jgi:hypothetical protein
MTRWDTATRWHQLVHHAAADLARNPQRGLTQCQPAIQAEYGTVDNFLRDLQRCYFTTALARLAPVIETSPADPHAPLAAVLAQVARVYPDLWQVLADHAGHPALAEGSALFRRSVLARTGIDPAPLLPGGSPRDTTGPVDAPEPATPPLVDPVPPGCTGGPSYSGHRGQRHHVPIA